MGYAKEIYEMREYFYKHGKPMPLRADRTDDVDGKDEVVRLTYQNVILTYIGMFLSLILGIVIGHFLW